MNLIQKLTYPLAKRILFYGFVYIPYAPISRVNKPENFNGPFIWCSSHSNFVCDVLVPAFEPHEPTKALAKATLFHNPLTAWFVKYARALPVVRSEDSQKVNVDKKEQNKKSFSRAIAALKQGDGICIFPEGGSAISSGLTLPLKTGVARLALAAEAESNFALGLKIIPVGLDYGKRVSVGSGLCIRYANPILVSKYKAAYEKDEDLAVKNLMEEITDAMISVFPHFEAMELKALGRQLLHAGVVSGMFEASQKFRTIFNDAKWKQAFLQNFKKFEEDSIAAGVPIRVWGQICKWQSEALWKKILYLVLMPISLAALVWDIVHNTISEYLIKIIADFFATDETEYMSYLAGLAPFVVLPIYAVQYYFYAFIFLKYIPLDLSFPAYCAFFILIWYGVLHWKRKTRMWFSYLFFSRRIQKNQQLLRDYARLQEFFTK